MNWRRDSHRRDPLRKSALSGGSRGNAKSEENDTPFTDIQLIEGVFDDAPKQQVIEKITKTVKTEEPMTLATKHMEDPILSHNAIPSATWSSGGAAYDEISRGILDAIEHCTNRLAPSPDGHVLDVATGTGWAARRLAARGFRVTGVDFAPDMLATAEDLAGTRNLDIAFELGDAEALPYPDASFDAVMSSFGIMFVQRPEDAAAEIARVCKPGGRIALAT